MAAIVEQKYPEFFQIDRFFDFTLVACEAETSQRDDGAVTLQQQHTFSSHMDASQQQGKGETA